MASIWEAHADRASASKWLRFRTKELLAARNVKVVLREVERMINVHAMKPVQRLERTHHFKLLNAILIEAFRRAAKSSALPTLERQRLRNFFEKRWPGVSQQKHRAS